MIMRKIVIAVIIFGFVLLGSAKETETIDQLKARAAAAEQKKQAELYSQLAKMQLEAGNSVYETHADVARNLIADSADSAEKAATASMESRKREKKTEIDLRELAKRMDDIGKTWAFDDRAPIKAAIQRVENARSKLLDRMFQK
jgi:hypothetical protein